MEQIAFFNHVGFLVMGWIFLSAVVSILIALISFLGLRTQGRLSKLEAGQAKLEAGQDRFEKRLDSLEAGQDRLSEDMERIIKLAQGSLKLINKMLDKKQPKTQ